jgi:hypothetical protein
MVTSAHRVEVEVGADGHASASLSGAAAAAPPAGAAISPIIICEFITYMVMLRIALVRKTYMALGCVSGIW